MPYGKTLRLGVKAALLAALCLAIAAPHRAQELNLVVQTGHADLVMQVSFTADGRFILSASADDTIRLWDARTGKEVRALPIRSSFLLTPDGKSVASVDADRTIRIWDLETGADVRVLQKHHTQLSLISFSPDGTRILVKSGEFLSSGGFDIKLLDAATGAEIRTFRGHEGRIEAVALSPDGKRIVSAGWDRAIKLWDAETGAEIRTLPGHPDWANAVAFSPDGKLIVSGSGDRITRYSNGKFEYLGSSPDNVLKIWDAATGAEVRTLKGHTGSVHAVSFSPDGRLLLTGSSDDTLKLWNPETGAEIRTLKGHTSLVGEAAFSPDGKLIVSGSLDRTIRIWDVQTGAQVNSPQGRSSLVVLVRFSPDGRQIVSGTWDQGYGGTGNTVRVWSAGEEAKVRTLTGHTNAVSSLAYSPDGKILLSASENITKLWDAQTGAEIRTLGASVADFSPDGKLIAGGMSDGTVKLWDAQTGTEIRAMKAHSTFVSAVAFSPDGKRVASKGMASQGEKEPIKLWNVETGAQVTALPGSEGLARTIAFSPDGKQIASARWEDIKIWDAETGAGVRTLSGHSSSVASVSFSPDGKQLLSGSWDKTVKLWDAATGAEVRTLRGHVGLVESAAFSPDGKLIVSGGRDTITKIWDAATGKELASLIAADERDWVVIDPAGRFDASEGALKLMHYSSGTQTIDLAQFKDEYLEPDLFQRVLDRRTLRAVVPLKEARQPPEVVEHRIEPDSTRLTFKLKNRGGGFGEVRVFVNDKLAIADARDAKLQAGPDTAQEFVTLAVDLKDSAYVKGKICLDPARPEACRDNKITIITSNYLASFGRSNITSRGAEIVWAVADDTQNYILPTLYAIVGGVSDYEGTALDLKFAAKDAEDFANALRVGAQQLFCPKEKPGCLDKVQITTLSTSGNVGTVQPTKENFRREFARIAHAAKPTDIFLVYLAGHGVSLDKSDTYFYLTREASSTNKDDLSKNHLATAISSDELLCWLTPNTQCDAKLRLEFDGRPQFGAKALSQVVILDTCAAGKAGRKLTAPASERELTTDQRRAIEFLKDRSGTHILMGSTEDRPSYEASQFGQGLLTRALLEGMSGAGLEEVNRYVDVQKLFRYVEWRVPQLAQNIGGVQRPTNSSPSGKTFVIGQMSGDSASLIRLPTEKYFVLRPALGNANDDNYDTLKLNDQLAKLLNDENNPLMTRGREPSLVYLNEEDFPRALKPTGFYWIEKTPVGDVVRVKMSLRRDGSRVASFEFSERREAVVARLLEAIKAELKKLAI